MKKSLLFTGQFKHTFYEVTPVNEPVYVWSGQVQQFRDYSQQIRVLPKDSEANRVTVKLGGQEAKYQVSGRLTGQKWGGGGRMGSSFFVQVHILRNMFSVLYS